MHNHQREQQPSGIVSSLLMRMFGRPKGILFRLGGFILARTKRHFTQWVIHQLDVQPDDKVLEVGFGPGVGNQRYEPTGQAPASISPQGAGNQPKGIEAGSVQLQYGLAEALPFADETFDKALTINSMQVWTDAMLGLREMRRVMRIGGKIVLGFTSQSGQSSTGFPEMLTAAGFTETRLVKTDPGFCVLAVK